MTVTYNTPPSTAGNLGTTEPTSCPVVATDAPRMFTTTPELRATATDPEREAVQLQFEVQTEAGAPVTNGSSAFVASGQNAAWRVPAGKLANNTVYRWRALGYDGRAAGTASGWNKLRVDTAMDVRAEQVACALSALDQHSLNSTPGYAERQIRFSDPGQEAFGFFVEQVDDVAAATSQYRTGTETVSTTVNVVDRRDLSSTSSEITAATTTLWSGTSGGTSSEGSNRWKIGLKLLNGTWMVDAIETIADTPAAPAIPFPTTPTAGDHPAVAELVEEFSAQMSAATAETELVQPTAAGFEVTHSDGTTLAVPDQVNEALAVEGGVPTVVHADADNSDAQVVGGAIVYPDTAPATSTVVTSSSDDQLETFFLLEDSTASDTIRTKVELAPGERLDAGPDRVAAVLDANDEPVMFLDAEWAIDARGNDVPLELTAAGDELVITVDSATAVYPILVDPSIRGAYYSLSGAEKSWCKWPWRYKKCYDIKKTADKAYNSAAKLYAKNGLKDGKGDAYRHCYWSALMTVKWGEAEALEHGTRHESDTPEGAERTMDLENNGTGRDRGDRYRNDDKSRRACAYLANGGFLYTLKNGKLVYPTYGPTSL